jgi:hypothetical protein
MKARIELAMAALAGALVCAGAPVAQAQGRSSDRLTTVVGDTNAGMIGIDPNQCIAAMLASEREPHELGPSTQVLDLRLSRSAIEPAGYGYPYHDPFMATITAAALNADGITPGVKRQVVHVPVLPHRNGLPALEGRGYVSVALYRQRHPAPLLFILSGIGSSAYFGLGTHLAGLFHREGFHVAILPSPMNWDFALAASRSGAPGYPPEDARDVYDTMQKTLAVLRARYDVDVRGVSFLGVSLGALEGAYLSVLDADEGKIGIEKYLLVNPPLDLEHAIETLDGWMASRESLGPERSARLRGKALAIVEAHAGEHRVDPAAVDSVVRDFSGFTTEELQYLIAQYVQMVLPELVYVTQAIYDQHLLATPRDQVRKRLAEARAFTLKDYTEKIGMPVWRREGMAPSGDSAAVSQQGSLAPILDRLRGNPRVHIMHNADDILADRQSIEALKEEMGDQMTLYPYGGHLGNLWYPPIRDQVLALFRPVLEARQAR